VYSTNHAYEGQVSTLSELGGMMVTSPRVLIHQQLARQLAAQQCRVHTYQRPTLPAFNSFVHSDHASIPNTACFGQRRGGPVLPAKPGWTRPHELPPSPRTAQRLFAANTAASALPTLKN
jgi:hypothetical protein